MMEWLVRIKATILDQRDCHGLPSLINANQQSYDGALKLTKECCASCTISVKLPSINVDGQNISRLRSRLAQHTMLGPVFVCPVDSVTNISPSRSLAKFAKSLNLPAWPCNRLAPLLRQAGSSQRNVQLDIISRNSKSKFAQVLEVSSPGPSTGWRLCSVQLIVPRGTPRRSTLYALGLLLYRVLPTMKSPARCINLAMLLLQC